DTMATSPTGTPSVPPTTIGDSTLYPYGQPSYQTDTTSATPIEKTGTGNLGGHTLNIGAGGGAQFEVQYWKIRDQGAARGGPIARVEVLPGALIASRSAPGAVEAPIREGRSNGGERRNEEPSPSRTKARGPRRARRALAPARSAHRDGRRHV